MLLDQVGLEYEGRGLARHHDRFQIRHVAHHHPRLRALRPVGTQIAPDARPQALGLPDVQDHSRHGEETHEAPRLGMGEIKFCHHEG